MYIRKTTYALQRNTLREIYGFSGTYYASAVCDQIKTQNKPLLNDGREIEDGVQHENEPNSVQRLHSDK